MPLAPKLPERIPFEKLSRVPYGAPLPLPFKLVGFRVPKRGEWYASGAEPAGYLALGDLKSPYWIVEPILTDAQRNDFRVQDWWKVAKPLTVWLVRDDRRGIRLLNPDARYVAEFLIDSPLGRSALCAVLMSLANAGYKIARYGGETHGTPVDPTDATLSSLR